MITVFDLTEFIRTNEGASASMTISSVIDILQDGLAHDCPKCEATGGYAPAGTTDHVICEVCNGMGKTATPYVAYCVQTDYRPAG